MWLDIAHTFTPLTSLHAATRGCGVQAKVIDLNQQRLARTLRGVHRSMLSCTLMRNGTHKADVLTGGLDSVVCRWDGASGRPLHAFNLQDDVPSAGERLINPPMAYALAQPCASESSAYGSVCVPAVVSFMRVCSSQLLVATEPSAPCSGDWHGKLFAGARVQETPILVTGMLARISERVQVLAIAQGSLGCLQRKSATE